MTKPGLTPLENLPPERRRITARLLQAGVNRWSIEEMLNAFAHELAEQQRDYAREVGLPLEDGDTVAAGDVIDLIDPHVGAGPVRPDEEPTT
jgi:hypothetical protein